MLIMKLFNNLHDLSMITSHIILPPGLDPQDKAWSSADLEKIG